MRLAILTLISTAAFAQTARQEPGTVVLESGVIVTSIKEGSGASPTGADSVKVMYRGTLPDGVEFDSSYKRDQPATFPLRAVIPCWTEGVQKMKERGKAKLVCPPSTAYGERGRVGKIPPNATLIFEIELLEVIKKR